RVGDDHTPGVEVLVRVECEVAGLGGLVLRECAPRHRLLLFSSRSHAARISRLAAGPAMVQTVPMLVPSGRNATPWMLKSPCVVLTSATRQNAWRAACSAVSATITTSGDTL